MEKFYNEIYKKSSTNALWKILQDSKIPDLISNDPKEKIISDLKNKFCSSEQSEKVKKETEQLPFTITPMIEGIIEVIGERENKLREWVNNYARNALLPTASGKYLDSIVPIYGIKRIEGETDESLRYRALFSIDGFTSSGSSENYLFHVLYGRDNIHDVSITSPRYKDKNDSFKSKGEIEITLLPKLDARKLLIQNTELIVDEVKKTFNLSYTRPLTDKIAVNSAKIICYTIEVKDVVVRDEGQADKSIEYIESQLQKFAQEHYAIGLSFEKNKILGCIYHHNLSDFELKIKFWEISKAQEENTPYVFKEDTKALKPNEAFYCNFNPTNKDGEKFGPEFPNCYGIMVSLKKGKEKEAR